MESLQNRGPLTMKDDIYHKWTIRVRTEMEVAGSWPTGMVDFTPIVIAEYISRLQKAFWDEFPDVSYYDKNLDIYSLYTGERHQRLMRMLEIFVKIYKKIRDKGTRDRTYRLKALCRSRVTCWTCIYPGPRAWANSFDPIPIRPFIPFNNQANGI